jgi:hypothetical protein
MIPSSQTAALGRVAILGGINTVSMAVSIPCAAIDAHPDLKKTPRSDRCRIPSTVTGNWNKNGGCAPGVFPSNPDPTEWAMTVQ